MKRFLYAVLFLVFVVCLAGLSLAYWPNKWRIDNKGITPEQATSLRQNYEGPHHLMKTSDGETLFLRRWNPDSLTPARKDIAVLIFHGFTAYSGPYSMAAIPFSKGGYTTFGLDYRGHGFSGGNRGDSPNKERWIADLAEAIVYLKKLGFAKVVVMGHSLGVAATICAANAVPNEVAGLVLLSGAYESRPGLNKPMNPFVKAKIIASAVFRPSFQSVEYYREGMTVTPDTLFTFHYTPRFVTMLDVKQLRLPAQLNVPVLVGVGDKDELFAIDKVKEFYNLVPGNKKEFYVMKNATHAKIPVESWEGIAKWLDKTYVLQP